MYECYLTVIADFIRFCREKYLELKIKKPYLDLVTPLNKFTIQEIFFINFFVVLTNFLYRISGMFSVIKIFIPSFSHYFCCFILLHFHFSQFCGGNLHIF